MCHSGSFPIIQCFESDTAPNSINQSEKKKENEEQLFVIWSLGFKINKSLPTNPNKPEGNIKKYSVKNNI